jgi:pyruvate dehydrogenase E2 component (dihydrolipoamide acetyltransferase)
MISEVIIPDLGGTGGNVTLDEWLVRLGDTVAAGQPLFVVTTDKATVEVEAFRDGVVTELRAKPGDALLPGTVVALLADSVDEARPMEPDRQAPQAPASRAAPTRLQTGRTSDQPTGGRILASPLARRIAEAERIELAAVTGTGRQGQILKRDVLAALDARSGPVPEQPTRSAQRQPLSPMWKTIAERTRRSKHEAPHFYATITVDMLAALDLRHQAVDWAEKQGWAAPTITDLCLRATALTLREFPALNASYDGDAIIVYPDINIGLVVGLEQGMLIPVIHRADWLNLYALAQATRRIKQGVDAGQLSANQLGGGTFTLSNLGMFGVDSFTAVLNPPEAGILALGAVREQAAVVNEQIVPRPLMTATLSVDHRVVDGITAARFMQTFKEILENPIRLTLDAPMEDRS